MFDPEIVAAAKGLSEPMRDCILRAEPSGHHRTLELFWQRATIRALSKRGLLSGARLTSRGIAVRAYLESQGDEKL